jgi:hypothetical protein
MEGFPMLPVHFSADCSPDALRSLVGRACADPSTGGVMLLCASEKAPDPETHAAVLKEAAIPVFGGFFPEILHQGNRYRNGCLAIEIPNAVQLLCFPNLSVGGQQLEQTLAKWQVQVENRMLFAFMDGFSPHISNFRDALYNRFGLRANIVGAGTGCLSDPDRPTVLSSEPTGGLLRQAAVCAMVRLDAAIGISHGWVPCSEALRVTESKGNRIVSLNWQPAAQVYRKYLALDGSSCSDLSSQVLQAHPFGIARISDELVVRDPISADGDDSMLCIGDIPQGSFVYILSGTSGNLIQGARHAREQAESRFLEAHPESSPDFVLLFDCISRALYMGDRFEDELAALRAADPLSGALTVGEFANTGHSFLEFYNKTTLLTLISAEDC